MCLHVPLTTIHASYALPSPCPEGGLTLNLLNPEQERQMSLHLPNAQQSSTSILGYDEWVAAALQVCEREPC